MKTFYVLGSLAILNLFRCATIKKIVQLDDMPVVVLHMIGFYLVNPFLNFVHLNCHFKKVFSAELPLERFVKERFNIPELFSDNVDNDERELKYLLPFSKFKNPNHLYQALHYEFIHGNKFDVFQLNLLAFFDRHDPSRFKWQETEKLIQSKKFEFFFKDETHAFNEHASLFFSMNDRIDGSVSFEDFQEYILSNPENLVYIFKYFDVMDQRVHIDKWNNYAIASNMPDMFLYEFPHINSIFSDPHSLWTRIFVPKHLNVIVFNRINIIINNSSFVNEQEEQFYRLLNQVRFDPEAQNIEHAMLSDKQLLLLCICASHANKIDLFAKLLPETMPFLMEKLEEMYPITNLTNRITRIEVFKFLIDINEIADDSVRQDLLRWSNLFNILMHTCRVISIEMRERHKPKERNELRIVFKPSADAIEFGIPESIKINFIFDPLEVWRNVINSAPRLMKFDNPQVFQEFLLIYFRTRPGYERLINSENLKLIAKSEPLQQLLGFYLSEHSLKITKSYFRVEVKELLKVLDEPVPYLGDIVNIDPSEYLTISIFRTFEQLERFEILTGRSIIRIVEPRFETMKPDYFHYRLVFKYAMKNGGTLPENLSEDVRALLQIDIQ